MVIRLSRRCIAYNGMGLHIEPKECAAFSRWPAKEALDMGVPVWEMTALALSVDGNIFGWRFLFLFLPFPRFSISHVFQASINWILISSTSGPGKCETNPSAGGLIFFFLLVSSPLSLLPVLARRRTPSSFAKRPAAPKLDGDAFVVVD